MFKRCASERVLEALKDTRVVFLNGARQTGKSTLVRCLAERDYLAPCVTLDDLSVLEAARRDPTGFLAGLGTPAIIDEVQRVPDLLLAIKSRVDRDRSPGQYLLTGSSQVLSLPAVADALVGRMEIITLWPLSRGEVCGTKEHFIDSLFEEDPVNFLPSRDADVHSDQDSADLCPALLAGGYPEVQSRATPERRRAWFEMYLATLLQRDVRDLSNIAHVEDMAKLLRALAVRAAGLANYADLARDCGINHMTLRRYFSLLKTVFLVQTVPAFISNRLKRPVKSEKIFFSDTGLLSHLLDLTPARLQRDGRWLGPLVENFVVMELVKQSGWSVTRPNMVHFRDHGGSEVDLVLQSGQDRVVAVEIKASATVRGEDFKGISTLAEALKGQFHRGVVLYAGRNVVPFGKRCHAVPIRALWAPCG